MGQVTHRLLACPVTTPWRTTKNDCTSAPSDTSRWLGANCSRCISAYTVRRSDDRSCANGGSDLQAWSMRPASSADGGAAGVVDARPPAVEWPRDCEMACRRARCTMPRRSCSNFSDDTLPPVELSVSLKTSTAVWPRVLMLAATTETFATLLGGVGGGGGTHSSAWETSTSMWRCAPQGLDEVGQQARAVWHLDAEHGKLVTGVIGERLRADAHPQKPHRSVMLCSSVQPRMTCGYAPPHRRRPRPCGPRSAAWVRQWRSSTRSAGRARR